MPEPSAPARPTRAPHRSSRERAAETDVLVVGAGVAGLTAARALAHAGRRVTVLEKSRGFGGRCATRRVGLGAAPQRLDHGAQFVTARDPRFAALLESWRASGDARVWSHGFATWREGVLHAADSAGHPRWIFRDGMNRLGKLLADDLTVIRETRAVAVERLAAPSGSDAEASVEVRSDDGRVWRARHLVVAIPPAQASDVLGPAIGASVRAALGDVGFAPSFALLAGYGDAPRPTWRGVEIDASDDEPGRTLRWAAYDGSKRVAAEGADGAAGSSDAEPGPDALGETTVVAHLRADVASELFDAPPEAVADRMVGAVAALAPELAAPRWRHLHRWRYALATVPHPGPWLRDGPIVLCGDWCGGARVEAAFVSGAAAAAELGADVHGDPVAIWGSSGALGTSAAEPGGPAPEGSKR